MRPGAKTEVALPVLTDEAQSGLPGGQEGASEHHAPDGAASQQREPYQEGGGEGKRQQGAPPRPPSPDSPPRHTREPVRAAEDN